MLHEVTIPFCPVSGALTAGGQVERLHSGTASCWHTRGAENITRSTWTPLKNTILTNQAGMVRRLAGRSKMRARRDGADSTAGDTRLT